MHGVFTPVVQFREYVNIVFIIILVTIWKNLLLFSGTVVGIVAKKQCDKAITMKAIN